MKAQTKKMPVLVLALILFCSLLLAACNSSDSNGDPDVAANDPETDDEIEEVEEEPEIETQDFSNEEVTLRVATPWGEDYFMSRIGDFMEETLDHITLEHIDWDGTASRIEEIYAGNVVPDVFLAYTGQGPFEQLDMVFDLDEMVQQYGVDLSELNQGLIDEIRSRDKEGRLIGFPAETSGAGLHYNKEIFDLFGEPYPTEPMSWDELFELAQKLTGERDGTHYRGLEMEIITEPLAQLAVNYTDPDTGEVLLTSDPAFTKYMNLMEKFFSVPGLWNDDPETRNNEFANKTAAMSVNWHGFFTWFGGEEAVSYQENMDIAPMPYWEDQPNTIPTRGTHPWVINSYSEQKEAALQFLIASVSPEYQTILSRAGTASSLDNREVFEQFGADNEIYDNKNTMAYFEGEVIPPPERKSPWDQYVDMGEALIEFAESGTDVQSFLRTLEEESEAKIAEAKGQQ